MNAKKENSRFQNFTQANSIYLLLLLARITSKLLRYHKHLKTQFLAYLLALLAGWSCFCLVVSLVGLTVGFVIDGAGFIGRKVADSFFARPP